MKWLHQNRHSFFSATQSIDDRLGDVFSFIWASYIGLRETWWQVRGFHSEYPQLHVREIEKKFLGGLGVPGGIDFRRMFFDADWDAHEQEFSKWLLLEACTLYEGWVERICNDIFQEPCIKDSIKQLQFPAGKKGGKAIGYKKVIDLANSNQSALMSKEFLPTLMASRLNCWPSVNTHLIAYRYFKECRNTFIHSDGLVTANVLDWHAQLSAAQSSKPSPFRHNFTLGSQVLDNKIKLGLKDCTLFATLVRRLICTFDAALSVSTSSELLLERRLRALVGTSPKWKSLPANAAKRTQRVHRMLAASRIPEPQNFANVEIWMRSKGIIRG